NLDAARALTAGSHPAARPQGFAVSLAHFAAPPPSIRGREILYALVLYLLLLGVWMMTLAVFAIFLPRLGAAGPPVRRLVVSGLPGQVGLMFLTSWLALRRSAPEKLALLGFSPMSPEWRRRSLWCGIALLGAAWLAMFPFEMATGRPPVLPTAADYG